MGAKLFLSFRLRLGGFSFWGPDRNPGTTTNKYIGTISVQVHDCGGRPAAQNRFGRHHTSASCRIVPPDLRVAISSTCAYVWCGSHNAASCMYDLCTCTIPPPHTILEYAHRPTHLEKEYFRYLFSSTPVRSKISIWVVEKTRIMESDGNLRKYNKSWRKVENSKYFQWATAVRPHPIFFLFRTFFFARLTCILNFRFYK